MLWKKSPFRARITNLKGTHFKASALLHTKECSEIGGTKAKSKGTKAMASMALMNLSPVTFNL